MIAGRRVLSQGINVLRAETRLAIAAPLASGRHFVATSPSVLLDDELAESKHTLRFGEHKGAALAQHERAWTPEAQREVLSDIRQFVLNHSSGQLNSDDSQGVANKLMILRFLDDFDRKVADSCGDDATPVDRWSNLDLFCRPWVLKHNKTKLLRMEETMPTGLRALLSVLAPVGMPVGAVAAWVTVQSPQAFSRLHMRRIVGNRLMPWCVPLDASYKLNVAGADALEAFREVQSAPKLIRDVVEGDAPACFAMH